MKTYYSLLVSLFFIVANLQAQCTDPTPEVLGDFFVCSQQSQLYSVDTVDLNNTYTWTLSGGGTITTNGAEATIVWGDVPGSYLLTLVEEDGDCSGTYQSNVVIEGDIVLVCNDNLNISLANNCEVIITPDVVLESPAYEEDSYSIEITDSNGNSVPTTIDHNYVGQTLEVSITHLCSGNSCWGDITIEDKLAPVVVCESQILTCEEYQNFIPTATITVDNCGDAELFYTLTEEVLTCDEEFSRIITVVFTAEDESGNVSIPCTATYSVEKEFISDIDLPLSYDGLGDNNDPLSCSGDYPLNSLGNPSPVFTGFPGGLINCNSIEWTYSDINLPLCETGCEVNNLSYKVIREWVLVDWCTGEIEEYQQIIKVEDKTPPVFVTIDDITASVNPFDCSAQIILPVAEATDNCSEDIEYIYETEVGTVLNGVLLIDSPAKTMGEGVEITVFASDCCGNVQETSFSVTIEDTTPPVVVADSYETISLLPSGQATMYATSLNDGSYDNCGPIGISVKRMDNGEGLPSIDFFPPEGNDNAQYNEVIHFFCADIPNNPIMVQLQVCDDANMDGIAGNAGDNCNTAMVEVEVQDKFSPVIQCPADMTISCIEFNDIDVEDDEQLNELFGMAQAAATCDVNLSQTVTGTDELDCGEGFIFRNFTATNSVGTQTCTQTISVVAFDDNLLTCDRITFDGVDNNIYDWCLVNDNDNDDDDNLPSLNIDGCESVSFAEVIIDQTGLCTTVGVQVTVDTFSYASSSACKQYIVHYEVIDQCVFEENFVNPNTGQLDPFNSLNGYFEFYLEYNVVDTEAPVLTCENQAVDADDCEGFTGTISIVATDACTPDDQLFYEWKLDVGANGSVDLPIGGGWFNGNAVNGAAIGLSAIPQGSHIVLWRVNDGCGNVETCSQTITVNPETKEPTPYCFGDLSTAVMPTTGTIAIWANDFDAGSFDNCGGLIEFSMIPVIDIEGLSDEEAYDLSFNHPNVTQQPNGDYGFLFDCSYITNGVSAIVEIRVYVTDDQGNYDYCTAALRIDDNFDICEDETGTMTVTGTVNTEKGKPVDLVEVQLDADFPEFPAKTMTQEDGLFAFNNLFSNVDYFVTPQKNDDHLNGVSTLDIVLIQKHILGIETLESPYAMIAADVNGDCSVTGLDIVQIRKLILGIYSTNEFPDNTSWRFVDNEFQFTPALQPCQFDEMVGFQNMTSSSTAGFMGVKIGDINESAEVNMSQETSTRNLEKFELVVKEGEVNAGQNLIVPIKASKNAFLHGFQFTLNVENAKLLDVLSGSLELTDENMFAYDAINGIYTLSYHNARGIEIIEDEVLFSLRLEAYQSGNLSESIAIVDGFTEAEAYVGQDLNVEKALIQFRDNENEVLKATGFKLFQNEPNPFNDITNIGFALPNSAQATLTVYDVTGKVIYQITDTYSAGEHNLKVNKADLSVTGMMYYTLESSGYTATKKMIVIE